MIYVSKEQLKQVEYLIGQSMQGHHVLFDAERVRRAFRRKQSEESNKEVEEHIEKLMLEPTLLQKRAYLERLDTETYDRVIRTYFNIVENNIFEASEVRH